MNKMQGIEILSTGKAMPAKEMDNNELSTMMDTSDEWITTRTGIKSRHVCTTESCNSLAEEAGRQALERALEICPDIRERISLVIVASMSTDYCMPSTACLVKEALGLPDTVMAFDLNAACSGFVYGLQAAHGILRDMDSKYALIIGSEQFTKVLDYSDQGRSTAILFGDGAGAAVLRLSDDEGRRFYIRSWSKGDKDALNCPGVGHNPAFVQMDGSRVFRFAVKVMEQGIEQMLYDSGLTMDDVDFVVCHQANKRIIDHVCKKYKGYEDKFYTNIQTCGNTSAASVPIAFDDIFSGGLLKSGMTVLLVAFGAGLTWSSALFTV